MFNTLLIAEHEEFESPIGENKILRRVSCTVETDSYKSASRKGISCSMDASSDYVASEFLDMLAIEHSLFGQPSDSDSESLRERLWKQFELEALAPGNTSLGLDFNDETEEPISKDVVEDFNLSATIHEAELELQNVTSLVLHAASPIVLPAEMSSGIMGVLHSLQPIGNFSSVQRKSAENIWSLGLERTEAIFTEGCKSVVAGLNPIDLRCVISMDGDSVVTNLKGLAKTINTSEDIAHAIVSKDDTVILDGAGDKKSIEERAEQIRSAIEQSTYDYGKGKANLQSTDLPIKDLVSQVEVLISLLPASCPVFIARVCRVQEAFGRGKLC
jgi:hypothetical protein